MSSDAKRIKTQIKRQMEFYFSEGNLPKDKFLLQQIATSADGFVSLDVFLTFNKIRPFIESPKILARCLKKSRLLELNADKTGVRRRLPLRSLDPVDERTVYLEGLPPSVEPADLERHFAPIGKVLFVSLPRYPTSGDLKGFGFVEFESASEAKAALALMADNGPAAGVFPPANKQHRALQRRARELGLDLPGPPDPRDPGAGDVTSARAASKRRWLRLRSKYFARTAAARAELARRVRAAEAAAREEQEQEEAEEEEVEEGRSGVAPGSVLRLQPPPTSREELRSALAEAPAQVAYVDVDRASGAAFVRCASAEDAEKVAEFCAARPSLGPVRRLQGAEEEAFRARVEADRLRKREKHRRRRKRANGEAPEEKEEKKKEGEEEEEEEEKKKEEEEEKGKKKKKTKEEEEEEKEERNGWIAAVHKRQRSQRHRRRADGEEEEGEGEQKLHRKRESPEKEEKGMRKEEEEEEASASARKRQRNQQQQMAEGTQNKENEDEDDDEDEEERRERLRMTGTVLLLSCPSLALSRRSIREALAPVATRVAHLDVIDGDSRAFVRCRGHADLPPVAAALEGLGGSAEPLRGQEERRYIEEALRARRAKRTKNAKRRWKQQQQQEPPEKMRKT